MIAGLLVPALALTGLRLDAQASLRAVRPAARAGRPAGHDGGLPGGHAAPPGVELHVQPRRAGPVPAHDVQGGAARRARDRVLAGLAAARRAAARAARRRAGRSRWSPCWPLVRGRGVDDQLLWERDPGGLDATRRDHVDDTAGDGRAVVLPGQLYAYYDWGGTIDPILPVLADKPVATRNAVGYADLRATDLLWTVDALVQQRRALPGQLDPLLDLLGARTVLAGRRRRPHPQRRRPGRRGGRRARPARRARRGAGAAGGRGRAPPGRSASPVELPQVRAWDRPGAPGLVRVEPPRPATGRRRLGRGPRRAARPSPLDRASPTPRDLSPDAAAAARREVVITDSNRRRVLVPSRLAQNAGPVLAADEAAVGRRGRARPVRARAATRRPSPSTAADRGRARAVLARLPAVPRAPAVRGARRRPGDALAGRPRADAGPPRARRCASTRRATSRTSTCCPTTTARAKVTAVEIAGRTLSGRATGWNRLRLGLQRRRRR